MRCLQRFTKLDPRKTLFVCCDIQEKFKNGIPLFDKLIKNTSKLMRVGNAFKIPLIVSEQYPKGLGHTVKELPIKGAIAVIPKTEFSMCVPELLCHIEERTEGKPEDLVLFGVETHVCVLQSAMDFIEYDYKVHVVSDCSASRKNADRDLALFLMRQNGCFIQTAESVIFSLLKSKTNPIFKTIKEEVRKPSADMCLAKRKDKKHYVSPQRTYYKSSEKKKKCPKSTNKIKRF